MLLGDAIHSALASVGITPAAVEAWIGRPCGCEERRQKLNALSLWAGRVAGGRVERAGEILRGMME